MAAENEREGDWLWRGGERIPLAKEPEVFTALVRDEAELQELNELPGVQSVHRVQTRVFKADVAATERDEAMARFRGKARTGVCHHAYLPRDTQNTRYYLTSQIVVRFASGSATEHISKVLEDARVRILRRYRHEDPTFLVEVTDDARANPVKVANRLAAQAQVRYAEPNLINRHQAFHLPSDPLFDQQWHLQAMDDVNLVAGADISAPAAWDITRGDRAIVVAVIDDGVDLSHPDFTGGGKVVHPKDYIDGDSNPFPAGTDYHGTPCAGVAVAEENGEGTVGAAPRCALMPVRIPIAAADDALLFDIFDHVGRHADVISCSWGPPPVQAPLSTLIHDQFTELATAGGPRGMGCVILFASGNYNAPLNDPDNSSFRWRHPQYGLQVTQGPILNGFATHPHVMAVAASTSLNRKAAYSNWGAEISVAAPSNNFHPLQPSSWAPGLGIWTTDNEQFGADFDQGSRFTGRFGGTSSATPLVAGVAALVLSANPQLTAQEVRRILEDTADQIVDETPDVVLGRVGGTYDEQGHSDWFGHGKVNAAAAVAAAAQAVGGEQTPPTVLLPAASAEGQLSGDGEERLYRVLVGSSLAVTLAGPDGEDFDLYVKRGAAPTTDDYDAVGFSASSNERVAIPLGQAGEYFIMVRSYRGAGDFDLRVDLDG